MITWLCSASALYTTFGTNSAFVGTRFTSYMKRLKKMDQERLAEAIGTRLDTSANTLRIPEMSKASQSNVGSSREAVERTRTGDRDLDWD